jgi:hypothetical protein
MVSSAIWEKHARVSFSKTIKLKCLKNSRVYIFFKLHEKPYYYLLIIYMKKLCSHVHKSHLEIKKIKKF